MRNLLAPSAGVRRPICWNLAQMVVWQQRDSFNGEDEPPAAFAWPWPAAYAEVVDAFG